jgi:hypothetical protein
MKLNFDSVDFFELDNNKNHELIYDFIRNEFDFESTKSMIDGVLFKYHNFENFIIKNIYN